MLESKYLAISLNLLINCVCVCVCARTCALEFHRGFLVTYTVEQKFNANLLIYVSQEVVTNRKIQVKKK